MNRIRKTFKSIINIFKLKPLKEQNKKSIVSENLLLPILNKSFFSMLGKLAYADGIITDDERDKIKEIITDELEFQDDEIDNAFYIFELSKKTNKTFEDYAQQFYDFVNDNFKKIIHEYPNIFLETLDLLLKVAFADNEFHPNEQQKIYNAKQIFKISTAKYESIVSKYKHSI